MGGFYGSVQVRSEDRQRVLHAAGQAALRAQIRCFVGPLINGWIGVYPEGAGQDQSVGKAIARQIDGDVLQLAVHDDGLLVYWLWHDAELADEYWSRPGYFFEADRTAQTQMSGDPQAFGDLLLGHEQRMLAILHRRRSDVQFESARLAELAEVLGIRNTVTSYEYLKAGESVGIERFDEFVEVPADAIAAEQSAARLRRQRIAAYRQQLMSQGKLLVDVEEEHLSPHVCAAGGGFLVAWEGHGDAEARLDFFRAPWGEAEPAEIETGGMVNCLVSDRDGRHVAMALGNRVVVWETESWQPILELVESDWATRVAITPDGRRLAYASGRGVFVHDIATGKRITAFGAHETNALTFDPSGQWLIMGGASLWIAQVDGTEPWRELYPGGRVALAEDLSNAVRREMTKVNVAALEAKWRASIEASVQKLAAAGQNNQAARALVAKMQEQMDRQIEQLRASFANLKEGKVPAPRQAKDKVLCAGFTRDGAILWLGTDNGLHLYDWRDVAAAQTHAPMPTPRFSHAPLIVSNAGMKPTSVHAVAQLRDETLFFSATDGQLCEVNLQTREVREVLTVPDGGTIHDIQVADDGSAISVSARPSIVGNEIQRAVWEIWGMGALIAG